MIELDSSDTMIRLQRTQAPWDLLCTLGKGHKAPQWRNLFSEVDFEPLSNVRAVYSPSYSVYWIGDSVKGAVGPELVDTTTSTVTAAVS